MSSVRAVYFMFTRGMIMLSSVLRSHERREARGSNTRHPAMKFLAFCAFATWLGCGGSTPVPLTCDDTMKTTFKPDANTNVVLVKAFKKGDSLALSGTPSTPTPPAAAADLCMVKMVVGPGFKDPNDA